MNGSGLPEPLNRLIEALSNLPGIGEKTATRLAFHILRERPQYAQALVEAIRATKETVRLCTLCMSFTADDVCAICASPERDKGIICVIEDPLDMLAIERSGEYKGTYHVLHGVISPIDGIGPEDLKFTELISRIEKSDVREVIVATNPSVEGEATALYIARLIKPAGITVTRIAHGIPVGGNIEYIDELTLGKALRDRKQM